MLEKKYNHLSVEKDKYNNWKEKGYFEFGGSTVVLLVKKDMVKFDADILENSAQHIETVVKYGEKIGETL